MIKTNYDYSTTKIENLKKYEDKINSIVCKFKEKKCLGNDFLGWYDYPNNLNQDEIRGIIDDAKSIRNQCNAFVVCGIGGSYLGARAVIEAINGIKYKGIEIIYMGNTFDEEYTKDMLDYLKNKEFCVNVISKSGSTLETAYAFRLLKDLLKEKYGDSYNERIFATTDAKDGCLRLESENNNYKTYIIPKDIGGRYSVFTPVGLLPLAVAGIDIEKFILGARDMYKELQSNNIENNIAYQYAAYRYNEYLNHKSLELFVTYKPYLNMISEWWKQLFGESEGKNERGLFPASATFSTDLHSLGQFVQEGTKLLFITQIKVYDKGSLKTSEDEQNFDNLNYLKNTTLSMVNDIAQEGTNKAHFQGGVNNFTLELEKNDEYNIGMLMYFFMFSCMISANLLGVNPFNQPGVEFYKTEMKKILKKQ